MSIQSNPYVLLPVRQSNALGTAGFVISLVGIVATVGLLCPIGLLLSLIALGRQPRGLAIAGVILGVVGSCGGLLAILIFGTLIVTVLGLGAAAAFIAISDPERTEVTVDMATVAEAVQAEQSRTNYLPASLSSLNLDPETLSDPWQNSYTYTLTEESPGFDLISNGKDGQAGTDDDIRLSKLDEYWNNYFNLEKDEKNHTVKMRMGDRTIIIHGDDKGGKVDVKIGDRTIKITGGRRGGHITVVPEAGKGPAAPESQAPETPEKQPAAPSSPHDPATPAPPAPP